MDASGYIVVLGLALLAALIPSKIAAKKGRSAFGFFVLGFCFLIPAIIIVLILRPVEVRSGDIVSTRRIIHLNNGFAVPRGWKSKVHDTDVIDGVTTVKISGPSGGSHWIAKSDVRASG